MVVIHYRSKRKASGGRYRSYRKKRLYETGKSPTLARIAEKKAKVVRTRGSSKKIRILSDMLVNCIDPATKKASKLKMKSVLENPANKQYVRMNVLTKGAIVSTEKGNVKITNRPAQDGFVNGVLVK